MVPPALEQSPNLQLWSEKWTNKRTHWHSSQVHPALTSLGHLVDLPVPSSTNESCDDKDASVSVPQKKRVFVPLCGKTVDLEYLTTHPNVEQVVGIDGIAQAFLDFQQEHPELSIQKVENTKDDKFAHWQGPHLDLMQGDFFDLTLGDFQGQTFDLIFDRASLVAIDPPMRQAYMNVMGDLIRPKTGKILLVVVERTDPTDTRGPPFAFSEQDVRELYEKQPWVKTVTSLKGEADPTNNEKFYSTYYLVDVN